MTNLDPNATMSNVKGSIALLSIITNARETSNCEKNLEGDANGKQVRQMCERKLDACVGIAFDGWPNLRVHKVKGVSRDIMFPVSIAGSAMLSIQSTSRPHRVCPRRVAKVVNWSTVCVRCIHMKPLMVKQYLVVF